MSDLLGAVDALTKPIISRVIQTNDAGITCTEPTKVELPSLLDQLLASIQSSMGGSTSGASLAFEGAPLNTSALFEAMKITAQIDSWCHAVGIVATHQPAHDLRAWYAMTLARPETREFETKHLEQWKRTIESLLDPPRQKDLPDACPECGATEWWDPKTGARYHRPLVIRYKPDDPGDATGMCRACAHVWNARELAFAIEQAERHAKETQAEGA